MGYKKYSDAFKRDVLALVAEGSRSVAQLERDLGITAGLVYKWQQRGVSNIDIPVLILGIS